MKDTLIQSILSGIARIDGGDINEDDDEVLAMLVSIDLHVWDLVDYIEDEDA